MKKSLTLGLLACLCCTAFAQQNFFNDWYASDPDRPFVKLLVEQDGIYELTLSDLLTAGYDLSQAQPDSIQIFYRGEEIPLAVEANAQGAFESLTFYGRRNDGAVEAQMYRNPISGTPDASGQPNPNFSLYSDTSAYFLTWGSAQGLRYTTSVDTNYSNYTPEASYPFEAVWEPHPDSQGDSKAIAVIAGGGAYDSFHSLNCDFVPGEGYISSIAFNPTLVLNTNFLRTPDPIAGSQSVRFQLRIFHRSNSAHDIRVSLTNNFNTLVLDTAISFPSIAVNTYESQIQTTLSAQPELTFQALNQTADINHLTAIRIRYQRMTNLAGTASTRISEWPSNVASYFRFANAQGQKSVYAYDPENRIRYDGLVRNGDAHIVLNGRFYGKRVELVTDQGFQKPHIAPLVRLRNLCAPDSGVSFVIIAHRDLDSSAYAYARYRDTTTLGYEPLSAKVVFIDEIYDEFSYGAPTPQAIQQFVNCALENWQEQPKYILLWGKGRTWMRGWPEPIVPSWGYPANDIRFTTPYLEDKTAQLNIGRVNTLNNQEGFDYLDKVMTFEQTGDESWRNDGIFVGQGSSTTSSHAIGNLMNDLAICFEDSTGADREASIFNLTGLPLPNYHAQIDQGQGLITVVSDALTNWVRNHPLFEAFEYNNFGKFPLIVGFGNFGGDFAGRESFGERWIKEKDRGCIALLANSTIGYFNPLRSYASHLFCNELQASPHRTLGAINRATYQAIIDSIPGIQYRNHARQMNLQGDPALVIYPNFDGVNIEPEMASDLLIYPNPAIDKLILEAKGKKILGYQVIDIQGRIILEKRTLQDDRVQIDVGQLVAGTYVLLYEITDGRGARKIVVRE